MQSFWTPLRVGLVVALGVAAFGFGLYLIGAEKFGTDRTYMVYAIFDDATGQLVQTIALAPSATEPGRIGALYIQRNPDKLQGVLAALGRSGAAG